VTIELEVLADPEAVAARGSEILADAARAAIGSRGVFRLAVSGGRTPWAMLQLLSHVSLPWRHVEFWQVDERVAPDGDPDRNLTSLARLVPGAALVHPMPVTDPDLAAAAERYAATLPSAFDLVHLGMGDDGHTASLVPGDPALDVTDREVALTGEYRGRRRMTLTYPALDRARRVLWLVTGADKAGMLPRLLRGDHEIPSGRVAASEQLVVADEAAAGEVGD
jgi:6-phosphogluconolactonase